MWKYCKSKGLNKINKIDDPNGYQVYLSLNTKCIPYSPIGYDARFVQIYVKDLLNTEQLKKELLNLQTEYYKSTEVSHFGLNGIYHWFDKATRIGLVNAITIQKELGESTYRLWLDKDYIDLPVNKALKLLYTLESYAIECYNITQNHIKEINNLSTIEDCVNYDITKDYPNILKIQIE